MVDIQVSGHVILEPKVHCDQARLLHSNGQPWVCISPVCPSPPCPTCSVPQETDLRELHLKAPWSPGFWTLTLDHGEFWRKMGKREDSEAGVFSTSFYPPVLTGPQLSPKGWYHPPDFPTPACTL